MSFPRAVLFDLDDTIITEEDRAAALSKGAGESASALAPHNLISALACSKSRSKICEWEVAVQQRLDVHAIWHDHQRTGLPIGSAVRPDRITRHLPKLLEGA
jgi:hypothetical protein